MNGQDSRAETPYAAAIREYERQTLSLVQMVRDMKKAASVSPLLLIAAGGAFLLLAFLALADRIVPLFSFRLTPAELITVTLAGTALAVAGGLVRFYEFRAWGRIILQHQKLGNDLVAGMARTADRGSSTCRILPDRLRGPYTLRLAK
jgi:hypothetical protein